MGTLANSEVTQMKRETSKRVLLQMVKNKMKRRIMHCISSGSSLFAKEEKNLQTKEYNYLNIITWHS